MLFSRFSASSVPIIGIRYDLFSNEEIRKISVMSDTPRGIESSDLQGNGEAKRGGLNDPRLGGSNTRICATCGLHGSSCPGHFAHTVLAEPMINITFRTYIKTILECICLGCSNLLFNKDDTKIKKILHIKDNQKRFISIREYAKKISPR